MCFISASTALRQVTFGRPLFFSLWWPVLGYLGDIVWLFPEDMPNPFPTGVDPGNFQ
jgi:hypothetical protein